MFNPETWIPYQLAEAAEVHISIYDVKGQPIRGLPIGFREAGNYTSQSEAVYWNGRNDIGQLVTSGIYFYNPQRRRFLKHAKDVDLEISVLDT